MPADNGLSIYQELLESRRAELVRAITGDCVATIDVYRVLAPETALGAIDATLEHLFAAIKQQNIAPLIQWTQDRVFDRIDQGLSLSQAIALPAIFRHQLLAVSLPAVQQQSESTIAGIMLINSICDQLSNSISTFYSQRLALANAELHQFKLLAESVIDGISVADSQARITYANPAFQQLTGYGEQTAGMNITELVDQPSYKVIREDIRRTLQAGEAWRGVVDYRHASGAIFPLQISVVNLRNAAGAVDGTVMVARDIRIQQQQETRLRMFEALVEKSVDAMIVSDLENRITYVNAAAVHFNGFTSASELNGAVRTSVIAPEEHSRVAQEVVASLQEHGSWQGRIWNLRPDGSRWLAESSAFVLSGADGASIGTGSVTRDITDKYQNEVERAQLQAEIIRVQELALRELSTPLLNISDRVVVMPLIGSIDARRAQQVIEALLEGISSNGADTAILDITGVPLVDTQVADALLRAAQAVRLLGAQVILTGIRPEVAQTLVGLGANLSDIVSRSTLQSGIAYAIQQQAAGQPERKSS